MQVLTRNDIRKKWIDLSFTFDDLTYANLQKLRSIINKHMIASCAIDCSFRAHPKFIPEESVNQRTLTLNCRSNYFDKRQAITFEDNGFIGIAGWADDTYSLPIIYGFDEWLNWMIETGH